MTNCDLWDYVNGTKKDIKLESRALAAIVTGVKRHIYIESKGFSRVATLIEQLMMIRYSDCRDMTEYLNKKVKFAQQLKVIDNEIKDGVLAALIIVSFPDHFKPLITALENCGVALTTDLVKERLQAEE